MDRIRVRRTGLALALALATLGLAAPAQSVTPGAAAAKEAGDLYADLSGILHRQPSVPPLWWGRLTPDLAGRFAMLRELDARAGTRTFALDWFCQCDNVRHIKVPALLQVMRSSPQSVTLSVRLRLYGGDNRHLTLEMVRQDGWRIADIVDERGWRFSERIERAIARHPANR